VETTAPAPAPPLREVPSPPVEPAPVDLHVSRPAWLSTYTGILVALDATAMAAATLTAKISWLGINPESFHIRSVNIPYGALALATVPAWIVILALAGAYDLGPFATAPRVWVQIVRAGAQLLAVVAVAYYILHLAMLGRGVLAGLIPLAVVLTLLARWVARVALGELRRRGHARRRALLVGHQRGVDAVMHQIAAHPEAGVSVVGVSLIGTDREESAAGTSDDDARATRGDPTPPESAGSNGGAPTSTHARVAARIDRHVLIARSLARTGAEAVIIAGGLAQGELRSIAWMLEGTGITLLVTPAPADLQELTATVMRPVAGLPLLHLDR